MLARCVGEVSPLLADVRELCSIARAAIGGGERSNGGGDPESDQPIHADPLDTLYVAAAGGASAAPLEAEAVDLDMFDDPSLASAASTTIAAATSTTSSAAAVQPSLATTATPGSGSAAAAGGGMAMLEQEVEEDDDEELDVDL